MAKKKQKRRRPAPPPKPLTKGGKIVVAVSVAIIALAILISSLNSESRPSSAASSSPKPTPAKTSPTYKTDIVTYTYNKIDGTPWPWKVPAITVTCTSLDGDSTAVVNGLTYGITGREAINDHLRGYAPLDNILLHPDANDPTYSPFMERVFQDCKAGMVGH